MISFTINTISIGKGKWIGVFLERGEPNIVQVFERISNNPQSVTDEDCMVIELFTLLAYKARPGLDWTYMPDTTTLFIVRQTPSGLFFHLREPLNSTY